MNFCHTHPENPDCTKAYMLASKGQREKAIQILASIGYSDAERQVAMIEGFIQFQMRGNNQHVKRERRKR